MRSSTSSFDDLIEGTAAAAPSQDGPASRFRVLAACCVRARWSIVLMGLLLLVAGEAYMRMPFLTQQLEWQPDAELGSRLAPNQRGYFWLANMSMQTPSITLNSDGHRGLETDWSRPAILAVGDSEWFGTGVEESEVWNRLLENILRREPGFGTLQVVNAANPGIGPHQELVLARRTLAIHPVKAVLIGVSIGQRNAWSGSETERPGRVAAAEWRARIRRVTKFVPFLVNKVKAQRQSITESLSPAFLKQRSRTENYPPASAGDLMWDANRMWYEQMVEVSSRKGVPLVFVVQDLTAIEANEVLESHLRALARRGANVHVVRLGPERYGLDGTDREQLRAVVDKTLTLGRDPHGNPRQHQLMADAIAASLREIGVIEQIRR